MEPSTGPPQDEPFWDGAAHSPAGGRAVRVSVHRCWSSRLLRRGFSVHLLSSEASITHPPHKILPSRHVVLLQPCLTPSINPLQGNVRVMHMNFKALLYPASYWLVIFTLRAARATLHLSVNVQSRLGIVD